MQYISLFIAAIVNAIGIEAQTKTGYQHKEYDSSMESSIYTRFYE